MPQHSDKAYVLSEYEMPNAAKPLGFFECSVENSSNLSHTLPCEQGGMPMLDFVQAMKSDAELQVQMINHLSNRLDMIIQINDERKKESLACFEGLRSPISASKYIQRILKYGRVSECCVLIAVIYIERIRLAGHVVRLSSTSLQRLLAVAVMVAAKFFDEPFYSNKWWAQIAGLELRELNALEREFLFLLGFRLAVRREDYDACSAALAAPLAGPAIPPSPAPHFHPARQGPHDPAGVAAADPGPARSHPNPPEEQPEPMDIVSGAGRLRIAGGGCGSGSEYGDACGCGGGSGGGSECGGWRGGGAGRKLQDGPGPVAPAGPALLD